MALIIKIFLLMCLLSALLPTSVLACWGYRPMGMGGVFVAVADDANLAYWNRAGAAQLEDWADGEKQLVITSTLWNPNGYFDRTGQLGNTYYDSINFAQKLTDFSGWSLAASWSGGNAYCFSPSVGFKLPWFENMSVGIGYFLYRTEQYAYYGDEIVLIDYIDHEIHLDYLWKFHPEWSLGIHIEDFWIIYGRETSPDIPGYEFITRGSPLADYNFRPALAWQPAGRLKGLIANFGIYNALSGAGNSLYSAGFEYKMPPHSKLNRSTFRMGYYNYQSYDNPGMLTLGYSYELNKAWEFGYWGGYGVIGDSRGYAEHSLGMAAKF
ncbi:hypothetical protein ACFL31_03845 [Candidatus Margulisiibacteriota bacterium]